MSTIAELNQRITVANAESKRLNNERQVNIGKRETLERQIADAFAKYKSEYGVDLTIENLGAELERVSAEKTKEVETIERVLALINEGKYNEAEALVNPEGVAQEGAESTESQPAVPEAPATAQETAPTVPEPAPAMPSQPMSAPSQPTPAPIEPAPVISQPASVELAPAVPEPAPVMPSEPIAPAEPMTPASFQQSLSEPSTPPLTGVDSLVQPSAPLSGLDVTPEAPSAPTSKPTDFQTILGGTAFTANKGGSL